MPRRNSNATKTRHTRARRKRKPARPMEYNRRLYVEPARRTA